MRPQAKLGDSLMFRTPKLTILAFLTCILSNSAALAQVDTKTNCSRYIYAGATLNSAHILSIHANFGRNPITIIEVNSSNWAGRFSDTDEVISGTISGSDFSLQRSFNKQVWKGTCYGGYSSGISGQVTDNNVPSLLGSFTIYP